MLSSMNEQRPPSLRPWQAVLHTVIFEADTPGGKLFDIVLIASIVCSVLAVVLDSVGAMRVRYGDLFYWMEWGFTILFTIEYILRLSCVGRPMRYAASFFGVIDLLAIIPTYLSLFVAGTHFLVVIRVLRVLRVFRVLKLVQYVSEAKVLARALQESRRKIFIFVFTVLTLVVVLGSFMYVIEGEAGGFTSIPRGVYWAIVTMTTVGYGDISPVTPLGQALASVVMLIGYSIIAVPTGIVSAAMIQEAKKEISTQACPQCSAEGHDTDAEHCKFCGAAL